MVNAVGYGYDDVDEWYAVATGDAVGHIYSRNTNPTVRACGPPPPLPAPAPPLTTRAVDVRRLEQKVERLEGAEDAIAFSSGMAAISNTLMALLKPGDRVVSIKDSYGGTSLLFLEFLPKYGIECVIVETSDFDAIEAAVSEAPTALLYLETPTNPTLKVVDIPRLAAHAKAAWGSIVCVDNTFATPVNSLPLTLGADVVLHSASKFLGGHADALGGIAAGSTELIRQVYHWREIHGACLDPHAAYMLLRGLKTLQLRVERQNATAMAVAEFLSAHPAVESVRYPGLPTHPDHDVAKAQMTAGFGGMLSFSLVGGMEAMKAFLPKLKFAHRAANLGPVETTVGPPMTTSHVECTPEERAQLGIPEGLVRYSAGIEDAEDLIADLDQALGSL